LEVTALLVVDEVGLDVQLDLFVLGWGVGVVGHPGVGEEVRDGGAIFLIFLEAGRDEGLRIFGNVSP